MAYPQQSAHMGSRLQLIDAQGHTQIFTDELVIGRAATFVSVCQGRYEAIVIRSWLQFRPRVGPKSTWRRTRPKLRSMRRHPSRTASRPRKPRMGRPSARAKARERVRRDAGREKGVTWGRT